MIKQQHANLIQAAKVNTFRIVAQYLSAEPSYIRLFTGKRQAYLVAVFFSCRPDVNPRLPEQAPRLLAVLLVLGFPLLLLSQCQIKHLLPQGLAQASQHRP